MLARNKSESEVALSGSFLRDHYREILEVREDSEEARRWPVYQEPASPAVVDPSQASTTPELCKPAQEPIKRKPGPRKPKTVLAPLPGTSKAKKITTLEKSSMDWKAHLNSQGQRSLHDELDANRKGGGYLEKVEFLERVEQRKEDILEGERSTKRRKL